MVLKSFSPRASLALTSFSLGGLALHGDGTAERRRGSGPRRSARRGRRRRGEQGGHGRPRPHLVRRLQPGVDPAGVDAAADLRKVRARPRGQRLRHAVVGGRLVALGAGVFLGQESTLLDLRLARRVRPAPPSADNPERHRAMAPGGSPAPSRTPRPCAAPAGRVNSATSGVTPESSRSSGPSFSAGSFVLHVSGQHFLAADGQAELAAQVRLKMVVAAAQDVEIALPDDRAAVRLASAGCAASPALSARAMVGSSRTT